ncbi:MAG: phospho-sugar mutase [bacterium]|nr:phospho-sugar mutase [bacterium]
MNEAKQNLSKKAFENLEKWLNEERFSNFRNEILSEIEQRNWLELEDAFFKTLEFGTAGRRGKVGAGPNRINAITIAESAQALADYLREGKIENPSVAVAYDVRNSSAELAKICAEVLGANGVKVYFFEDFRSTPELSFAVRHLKTGAGIVISASHNPPEDNGIKIYWSDGAQISAPHDQNLLAIAQNISRVQRGDFVNLQQQKRIEIIGEEIDRAYISRVVALAKSQSRELKIAFSPIHGTGWTNLLKTLLAAGFKDIAVVEEQMRADGDFSSLPDQKPNPENLAANQLAIQKMQETHADIALTTDPDADRICVISHEKNGEARVFSGNETAILVADFILSKGTSGFSKPYFEGVKFICKSFVTTEALNILAQKYGVKIYDNLPVGFKFIGKKIRERELLGDEFLAGFEESLGGLVGAQVRDKDAATIGLMAAELAAELKLKNQTLGEKLAEIYAEIGNFAEKTEVIEFSGAEGFKKMQEIMARARKGEIAANARKIRDFENLRARDLRTGEISNFEMLEKTNAVSFEFDSPHRRIALRPSGTEPKLKIYAQWLFENPAERVKIDSILEDFKRRIL